jgi:hypothetical protein
VEVNGHTYVKHGEVKKLVDEVKLNVDVQTFAKQVVQGGEDGWRKIEGRNNKLNPRLMKSSGVEQIEKRQKSMHGKNNTCKLTAVSKKTTLDYFVSRIEVKTDNSEMLEHVTEGLEQGKDLDIKVTKLKTKFDSYASFHVSVSGVENRMAKVREMLEGDDFWPLGSYIRRYWMPKKGNEGPVTANVDNNHILIL